MKTRANLILWITSFAILFSLSGDYCIAQNNQSVGSVIAIQGTVKSVNAAGQSRNLALKSEIFQNDKVLSGKASKVQIMFNDNSIISQGEDGEMTIDEYVYSPAKKTESKCGMSFAKGIFRVVTGKITEMNPDRFKVKTRMATIGIRGCEVGFTITQTSESIYILGLPSGRSIIIEQAQIAGNIINKGQVSKKQVMEILKPGVVVHLQAGKKMTKRRISVDDARNIVIQSTADMGPHDDENGDPDHPGGDPNMPREPGDDPHGPMQGDPDMPFDPDMPLGPDSMMPHDPGMPMFGFDGDQPKPWELDPFFNPEGDFKPFFDPDNPDTWPPDPNFDPNDPSTWPDMFFYHPEFDPTNPDTWPPDPNFDPDNPDTWPQPPLFDPDNPDTWPDYPGFDPDNPDTWPPPDEGGPADNMPPDAEFLVLGGSDFWKWGKWVQDGELLTTDVFPKDQFAGDPILLVKGPAYAGIVADVSRYDLQTLSNPNITAAVFAYTGSGKKLMQGGTCDLTLRVGNGPGRWGGTFQIGTGPADNMSFTVPIPPDAPGTPSPGGIIDINGNLILDMSTINDLSFSAKIFGNNVTAASVTAFDVHGEMIGRSTTGPPPIDGALGWFVFEEAGVWKIKGAFASDLESTGF